MRQAVQAASRLLDHVTSVVVALAGTALVLLVLITGWMVFGRYVLNDTPTWVERGALLTVLWVTLPVAAIGVRERFHMAVEFFLYALPEGLRTATRVAADVLVGVFGLVMAWESSELVDKMWGFNIPLLGLPQGMQFLPLVICGVLTALFCAEHLARRAVGLPPIGHGVITLD